MDDANNIILGSTKRANRGRCIMKNIGAEQDASFGALSRRSVLKLSAATATMVSAYLAFPGRSAALAADQKFVAALGWTTQDSGAAILNGYKDAVATLGGTLSISDAGFDPKKQIENVDSLISSRPSAMFVTPADAVAVAPSVQRAVDARIPVFVGDSQIPGVLTKSTAMSNNFGLGQVTFKWLADRLGGKGKIGLVTLPQNESWNQRGLGMRWALRDYPGIQVVAEWPYNTTGSATPRQVVDNMLTANNQLDGIWCAWDGGAIEGSLAARAAGRDKLILTGIDGGPQAFSYIQGGSGFKYTATQNFYEMAFLNVFYAHELAAGRSVPRLAITPSYPVDEAVLNAVNGDASDFSKPGRARALGWKRVL